MLARRTMKLIASVLQVFADKVYSAWVEKKTGIGAASDKLVILAVGHLSVALICLATGHKMSEPIRQLWFGISNSAARDAAVERVWSLSGRCLAHCRRSFASMPWSYQAEQFAVSYDCGRPVPLRDPSLDHQVGKGLLRVACSLSSINYIGMEPSTGSR